MLGLKYGEKIIPCHKKKIIINILKKKKIQTLYERDADTKNHSLLIGLLNCFERTEREKEKNRYRVTNEGGQHELIPPRAHT